MNAEPRPPPARPEALGLLTRLALSPRFHKLAAKVPVPSDCIGECRT